MADQPTAPTATPEVIPAEESKSDQMRAAFEDAFTMERQGQPADSPTSIPETPKETESGEVGDPTTAPETNPDTEFETLMGIELKRFDERMSLKDYLVKHPEEVKEALQKNWDYTARKQELKDKYASEKADIEAQRRGIESVLIRNVAYEINMPLKTLEDFENDMRYEDAEAAFEEYKENFSKKAQGFAKAKETAEARNEEMIENFEREFKDIKVSDIYNEIKPYLNASVSMGFIPFPEDTLKVFYLGKNHDKIVEAKVKEAKEAERRAVYKELGTDPKVSLKTFPSQPQTAMDLKSKEGLSAREKDFEDAWSI